MMLLPEFASRLMESLNEDLALEKFPVYHFSRAVRGFLKCEQEKMSCL